MRYTLDDIKNIIKTKTGHEFIGTVYVDITTELDIKCTCGIIYQRSLRTINAGFFHCNGKEQRSKKISTKEMKCLKEDCNNLFKQTGSRQKYCSLQCSKYVTRSQEYKDNMSQLKTVLKPIVCQFCKSEFQPKHSIAKLCSKKCFDDYKKTDEIREKAKLNGQKGGKKSAHSQQRRSKNEVMFAELCEDHFGKDDVLCNEPIFDGWDADVIIRGKKIAVLWNGPWHYKQIMRSQSLTQVQARDRVKTAIITKYGYTPYVIKDMGKHNPKFVLEEFQCFLFSLIDLT